MRASRPLISSKKPLRELAQIVNNVNAVVSIYIIHEFHMNFVTNWKSRNFSWIAFSLTLALAEIF